MNKTLAAAILALLPGNDQAVGFSVDRIARETGITVEHATELLSTLALAGLVTEGRSGPGTFNRRKEIKTCLGQLGALPDTDTLIRVPFHSPAIVILTTMHGKEIGVLKVTAAELDASRNTITVLPAEGLEVVPAKDKAGTQLVHIKTAIPF